MNDNKDNECFVSWFITEKCNFSCEYCSTVNPRGFRKFLHNVKKTFKTDSSRKFDIYHELDDILHRFLDTGMKITFGFTGGEPFVYPRFTEICSRIIEHDDFMIALDTNLAIRDINRFIETVPPSKVEYIYASLHIAERERVGGGLDKFLDYVLLLQKKGYRIGVNYVMYPPFFERVERDYKYCHDRGIDISLKLFKGVYAGKKYPHSYTMQQKEVMFSLFPELKKKGAVTKSLFGLRCKAGRNLIRVLSNGDVVRCAGDFTLLGNIFTGFKLYDSPRPCIAKVCPCYSPERLITDFENREHPSWPSVYTSRLKSNINRLREWWQQE